MCIQITMPDSQHSNIIHQNNQKTPFNREDSKYFIHTQHQTNAEPQRRRNFCFLPNRALELITVIQKHNILQRFHLVAGCWLLRETFHSKSLLVLEINEWFGYTLYVSEESEMPGKTLSHTHRHICECQWKRMHMNRKCTRIYCFEIRQLPAMRLNTVSE